MNRKNNTFNKKEYYKKILRFSNCCIYINEPSSIDDEDSVNRMTNQYVNDKEKLFPILRPYFKDTCIFLINKIDLLVEESEKIRIKENILKIIQTVENNIKKDDVNISYFSGKYFLDYLIVMNNYVYLLNKEPGKLLLKLYNEYYSNFNYLSYNFKGFIESKISKIEENFFSDKSGENEEEEEIEIPQEFKQKIIMEIKKLENKQKLFKNKEDIEIINELYELCIKLKNKDFSNTYYSYQFFYDLKKTIEYTEKLFKENIKNNIKNFFKDIDILFTKEIKKEEEEIKKEKEKSLERFVKVNKNIENNFVKAQTNMTNIFKICRSDIDEVIDLEIKTVSEKLKESNNDINLAIQKLQDKISIILGEVGEKIKEGISNLIEEIQKDIDEIDKTLNEKNMDVSISDIKTNIGLGKKMFASFFASTAITIIGESSLASLVTETISATVGGAIGGPIGIAIGFAVGLTISLTSLLVHTFRKKRDMKKDLFNLEKQ